jgi:hypothetical protein
LNLDLSELEEKETVSNLALTNYKTFKNSFNMKFAYIKIKFKFMPNGSSSLWQSAVNHKDSQALQTIRTNPFSPIHLCPELSPILSKEKIQSSARNLSSSLWIKTRITKT